MIPAILPAAENPEMGERSFRAFLISAVGLLLESQTNDPVNSQGTCRISEAARFVGGVHHGAGTPVSKEVCSAEKCFAEDRHQIGLVICGKSLNRFVRPGVVFIGENAQRNTLGFAHGLRVNCSTIELGSRLDTKTISNERTERCLGPIGSASARLISGNHQSLPDSPVSAHRHQAATKFCGGGNARAEGQGEVHCVEFVVSDPAGDVGPDDHPFSLVGELGIAGRDLGPVLGHHAAADDGLRVGGYDPRQEGKGILVVDELQVAEAQVGFPGQAQGRAHPDETTLWVEEAARFIFQGGVVACHASGGLAPCALRR